ncbi:hypothetical protein EV200_104281 [Pedobacter psychrotolerans]|uniref:DUF6965 domain-containing protein n=1 Tax=Pedobacter psychrotolerans TaxID=1843235 RepID=A0A4R2HD42_9SPHI|nr:hypothetical protein [Pedobacter psychrotolerans]TCO25244.1 hypothetical protein EV200_104281 [Pedobacter psychrotolerans]GGE46969.1 hypothetical protein GCM10011413_11360 [Pedobacter psychrotolerans]
MPRGQMPVYLNAAVIVTDYDLFLESHFLPLSTYPDTKINKPIIYRLAQMMLIIDEQRLVFLNLTLKKSNIPIPG